MSIEAEKGMCRHDAGSVCWGCFDAVVDAEADRWIAKFKQSGYMTRNREQTRANIVRGLLIGTYQIGTQVRALRAYTGAPDYSKIEVQTEYKKRVGAALTARPLAQTG